MIIYHITHQPYRKELYKYLILNDTNFYLSPTGEKGDFVLLWLGLGLGLYFIIIHTSIKSNSVIMDSID